nr:chemotaxis protein CheX [uncultured bacterium]
MGTKTTLAKLEYSGNFSGYFLLFMPEELALLLAASFLGRVEDNVSHEHVIETKKEIINMIAGNTFTIFDDQNVFDLGIPQIVESNIITKVTDCNKEIIIKTNTLENCLYVKLAIVP